MDRSRTKLVCTIGPASAERVPDLVAAGMDVARINFSHGTPDDHKNYVHAVRAAAHSARRSVAVMADLPGPKIRLGPLQGDALTLETGSTFTLRPASSEGEGATEPRGDTAAASVSTGGLASQLEIGDRVLLADGAAELRVIGTDGDAVRTEVVHGGPIRSRAGVNIPSGRLTGDGLTEDDRSAVPRALELRVDLIAQSFVRSGDDVRALRALVPGDGPRLVAKIETQAAVAAFDEIAEVADGIMVARGDLGVDIPFEEVPFVQKDLVRRARDAERFTIVATQMLESMTAAPRPTRAEVSDVANAVLDGADAVMLSAETAIGAHPLEALQAMARICLATEHHPSMAAASARGVQHTPATATIMAATAVTGWTEMGAIWCFTRTGHTAEKLSMTRPQVPIIAFTLSPIVARRLAIRRGVIPMVLPAGGKGEPLIERMEKAWRAQRNASEYESVILVTTSQQPLGINRMEVHRLSALPTQPATAPLRREQPRPPRRSEDVAPPTPAQPEPVEKSQAAEAVREEPQEDGPEPTAFEPAPAEPAEPEPTELQPAEPEPAEPGPAEPEPPEPESAEPESAEPEPVRPALSDQETGRTDASET